jgi:hypothetical protein
MLFRDLIHRGCQPFAKIQPAVAFLAAAALTSTAQADVNLSSQWVRLYDDFGGPFIQGPLVLAGDKTLEPNGFALLIQYDEIEDAQLIVDGGSTLFAPRGLATYSYAGLPNAKADVFVDGVGSRIEIAGEIAGGVRSGNIFLRGRGDFYISNGGSVVWNDVNGCDGSFRSCDILIGDNNPATSNFTGVTNNGFQIDGTGSLLDASNTGGRLYVGFTLAPLLGQSEDFLVALNGGEIRSNGAGIAHGWEGAAPWQPSDGYLRGLSAVDNGTWSIQAAAGENSNLNIGEGDGASGFLAIVNGGTVNVIANGSTEAGFFLGQSADGVPTRGADNLLIVSGAGSRLTVDDNFPGISGSRIANGAVSIQDSGSLQLDSSILLVSGKTGRAVTSYFSQIAATEFGVTSLPGTRTLDVITGGSLAVTDNDSEGISALIIGQTPEAGAAQEAHVLVTGTVTVTNDPGRPKISLDATEFGIPRVSNIGTGTLEIGANGSVAFENGDFVIGVNLTDDATVSVGSGGQLTADRIVVGFADFDSIGPGVGVSETGTLVLQDGVVNGDVIVDDNGSLAGVGTVNGAVIGEGGTIAPGFSPGTISAQSFTLGPGTELVLEVALNPDGTVNTALSDSLSVSDGGTIDLSNGEVTFELSSTDASVTVNEILATDQVLEVSELFESTEEVVVADYNLTDPSGSVTDEELEARVQVVSFEKKECKKDGWMSLFRSDQTGFTNQGECIEYVNEGI